MPRLRRHHDSRSETKRTAPKTKDYLAAWIILLVLISLGLIFQVAEGLWPAWLVDHRTQVIGFVLLVLFFSICAFPIMVEADKNPRHLSGPGHNPQQGPGS